MSSITLETAGTRIYLIGNTYPVKDAIKAAGGHWDGERRAWWLGAAKRAEAERLATATPAPSAASSDTSPYDGEVRGTVTYTSPKTGKTSKMYVRWEGRTSRGTEAVRLVSFDGRIDFWADATSVQWIKRYALREGYRGARASYPTLSGLRRYAAQAKTVREGGDCPRCADREARGLQTGYCGSGDYDDCTLCGATYRQS